MAASVTNYGKGEIAAIYFNIGHNYLNASTTVCRDFLSAVVKELFPNPVVTVEGSHNVDVTLNRIKDKLTINLINSSGPHADKQVNTFDQIPTVGPLEVTVLSNKKPDAVTLQPGGQSLNFTFKQNEISFVVPKLEIHEIVVIE